MCIVVSIETTEETDMKFNLDNHKVALSHLVLQNTELAMQLADTPLWLNQGVLEATLQINGVDVSAELIEQTMQELYSRCEEFFKEKYESTKFDQRVEERAQELLKEHADNALERMYKLINVLESPDVLLTPSWERNSK